MRKLTKEQIGKIIESHGRWLRNDPEGIRANLSGFDLSGADLSGVNLSRANLSGADLSGVNLFRAILSEAILSKADLHAADLFGANLFKADLSATDLSKANLSEANLSEAILSRADLYTVNLSGANLSKADLSAAHLLGTNLYRADLSEANLFEAYMVGANLYRACLYRANLPVVYLLSGANLSEANLFQVKNLPDITKQFNFLSKLERTEEGYICYKTFGEQHESPYKWVIEKGSILDEFTDMNIFANCSHGINVATLDWVKRNTQGQIWKCLIKFEWLVGVVIPFATDGKFRASRVQLLEPIERA